MGQRQRAKNNPTIHLKRQGSVSIAKSLTKPKTFAEQLSGHSYTRRENM